MSVDSKGAHKPQRPPPRQANGPHQQASSFAQSSSYWLSVSAASTRRQTPNQRSLACRRVQRVTTASHRVHGGPSDQSTAMTDPSSSFNSLNTLSSWGLVKGSLSSRHGMFRGGHKLGERRSLRPRGGPGLSSTPTSGGEHRPRRRRRRRTKRNSARRGRRLRRRGCDAAILPVTLA